MTPKDAISNEQIINVFAPDYLKEVVVGKEM